MMKNPKRDCFGFDRYIESCVPLECFDCKDCRFYKTWSEYYEGQAKANKRLKDIHAEGGIKYDEKYE